MKTPKVGGIIPKKKFAAVCEEIEYIRKKHRGKLRPIDLFEFAQDPNTIVHGCGFEWDKKKAWVKYNLNVAREIIRSIEVEVITTSGKSLGYLSNYVSIPVGTKGRAYMSIDEAISNKDIFNSLLDEIVKTTNSWKRKVYLMEEIGKSKVLIKTISKMNTEAKKMK